MDVNQFAAELTRQTVVLMGISFMLGSLFTIFILLILDMLRAARAEHEAMLQDMTEEPGPVDFGPAEDDERAGR